MIYCITQVKQNDRQIRLMPLKTAKNHLRKFPKRHAIAASICAGFLFGIGLIEPASSSIERTQLSLNLPNSSESKTVSVIEVESSPKYQEFSIKPGDTLSTAFERTNLSSNDMYTLLNSSKEGKRLAVLKPGETFSYRKQDKQLQELIRHISPLKSVRFTRDGKSFKHENITIEPEKRLAFSAATIDSNLFDAAASVNIPLQVIMEMAGIFGGVMDFVYDPRKGDTFSVLFEELYVDGEYIGSGKIVASSYNNAGEIHEAYRYTDKNKRSSYFNGEGTSMRKAFLRAPVDFNRISSNFNPNRLHPIFKTRRPHRGIDYAAKRGTPVFSSGDGRVIKSTYNKASGHYVVVQHGPRYQTKYLHLHKRHVKVGQKINQGQVLGTVGSTGYATGPHLHYEFLLDGVHRNPRTILNKLPKAKSIPKSNMAHFLATIKPVQQQFAAYKNTVPFLAGDFKKPSNKKS